MATTDQQILSWLQQKVNEPADGGLTWPSGLWTPSEVISYINQRQTRFLKETEIYCALANIPGNAGQLRFALPQDCSAIWRVTWTTLEGVVISLIPAGELELDLGEPAWTYQTRTVPKYHIDVDVPVGLLGIAPAASDAGTLNLNYISTGDTVDGTGQTMTVPDEYVPTIRWGVLADMLGKNARAADPIRSAYADSRYDAGVAAAKLRVMGKI